MKLIKRPFYKIMSYLIGSDYFREQLWRHCGDLFCRPGGFRANRIHIGDVPDRYKHARGYGNTEEGRTPVFITGRFRSGSTFLWQLFRNIKGVTSYYEPFNERRWFLSAGDDGRVDDTHLGVSDYRREYKGMTELNKWFRNDWSSKHLYMNERVYDPSMYRYVRALVEKAPGRPVLQFNRVDFRLPWLKANFPRAKIIHLYRDYREQWMSVQRDGGLVPPEYIITETSRFDLFYLLQWVRDLRRVFPFLEPEKAGHPYALHYYLWRLSYAFGAYYSDYSVAYEDLVENLEDTLMPIISGLNINDYDMSLLSGLNRGKKTMRWMEYAPASWFEQIEAECDRVLKVFFSS